MAYLCSFHCYIHQLLIMPYILLFGPLFLSCEQNLFHMRIETCLKTCFPRQLSSSSDTGRVSDWRNPSTPQIESEEPAPPATDDGSRLEFLTATGLFQLRAVTGAFSWLDSPPSPPTHTHPTPPVQKTHSWQQQFTHTHTHQTSQSAVRSQGEKCRASLVYRGHEDNSEYPEIEQQKRNISPNKWSSLLCYHAIKCAFKWIHLQLLWIF